MRKARLYCVGTAKSGTHSIATMFNAKVRSQHEPQSAAVIRKIMEIVRQEISDAEVSGYLRKRDRQLKLDVDSSQLNYFLIDYLVKEFQDARFVLTIRDCYSWLDSFINDSLRRQPRQDWMEFREFRFRSADFEHPPEEQALQSRGLFTLDGYLSYWASHNNKVLATIPGDRLLVVKTHEITERAHDIARFAGLPTECVGVEASHSFKNPHKYNVLEEIDEGYLATKVHELCGTLMQRFFPEIQRADDARTPYGKGGRNEAG